MSFEMAVILYFLNLVAMILFYLLLIILAVPLAILAIAIISINSLTLLYVTIAIAGISLMLLFISFLGALTMFNYNIWTHLIARLERAAFFPAIESTLRKIFKIKPST